jgi:hypothetical protein
MRKFWIYSLALFAPGFSAHAFSYSCDTYRLMVRPEPPLVVIRRGNEICPEVAKSTYRSLRAKSMTRLKQVDRFEARLRTGVIDAISNSSYPNASCRRTFQLSMSENVVVWISDSVFKGEPDGTLEIEYADPKKPLETLRLKCQIDHP